MTLNLFSIIFGARKRPEFFYYGVALYVAFLVT